MAETHVMSAAPEMDAGQGGAGALLRTLVIGLMAFLTVVDPFPTQAIRLGRVAREGKSSQGTCR